MSLPPLDHAAERLASAPSAQPLAPPPFDHKKPVLPPYSPPSYVQSHDPSSLSFPDAPTTELALAPIRPPSAQNDPGNSSLPSLSSVTGPPSQPRFTSPTSTVSENTASPPPAHLHWPSLNPFTAYYSPSHVQADEALRMDVDMTAGADAPLASPERRTDARSSSVSLDDPDVRMAAEALGDLRAGTLPDHGSHVIPSV